MNDSKEFQEMVKGLDSVGFSEDEQTNIWKILVVVLLLGEIKVSFFSYVYFRICEQNCLIQHRMCGTIDIALNRW